MEARRRRDLGVVALVVLLAGGLGGIYLWKTEFTSVTETESDAGLVGDAAGDAHAKRSKSKPKKKSSKRVAQPGKPRANPSRPQPSGSDIDDGQDNGDDDDDGVPFQPPFRGRGPAGPTYEMALASNRQEIAIGHKSEPDLTDAQLNRPMQSGAFVGECGAPDSMKVTVRVAVKMGHAAGVSVSTSPLDADIAGCIDRYVRTFSWPVSSKMDSFTTTY